MIKKFLTMLALACLTATGAYADGPALTPTANENEWTFTMPAYDAELKVTYYTDQDYANDVTNLIAAIGAFEPTSACKAKIDAARAAYDALTDDQKALVANYDVLEAVEADYNAYYHGHDRQVWRREEGEERQGGRHGEHQVRGQRQQQDREERQTAAHIRVRLQFSRWRFRPNTQRTLWLAL